MKKTFLKFTLGKQLKTKEKEYKRFYGRVSRWVREYGLNRNIIRSMALYSLENEKCPYCDTTLYLDNISLDRSTPQNRGGDNSIGNLQFTCKRCNRRKGELTDSEFKCLLSLLKTFPEKARKYVLRKLSSGTFFNKKVGKGKK